jgi:3-hydroxyacyl-CoA dehydrogenase
VAVAAESYIGLVEAGVGLIPGGGGTMEFTKRLSASFYDGDVMIPRLVSMFRTIAMAEVATSAPMAFDLNYLLPERDRVVLNSREVIYEAKNLVLAMSDRYLPPLPGKLFVLGRTGLATLMAAISEFKLGSFISDHDALIARKTAWVMCGGDLSAPQEVSEQYLLDLEREAFVGLCGEQKTLDRIRYMLKYNKPLRN